MRFLLLPLLYVYTRPLICRHFDASFRSCCRCENCPFSLPAHISRELVRGVKYRKDITRSEGGCHRGRGRNGYLASMEENIEWKLRQMFSNKVCASTSCHNLLYEGGNRVTFVIDAPSSVCFSCVPRREKGLCRVVKTPRQTSRSRDGRKAPPPTGTYLSASVVNDINE